ncbi:MAG TPA: TIM barrel protein [Phycisphaerae bacterium]|jgi:hydroxypyruvate isomerase|nr:TIM barrel protein [Phycisphaerae bacterium]HOB75497.1 TIM barrel protein [Phycisphaerae bacterium]HOJ55279.1 TIM barrel protein [Phycisphaerae bacterium]HPP23138.1 TIM barrel protein [Phycisphaerae bacterium]HPU33311.1 TIM barrel protein [Phycisphaerae bacterium]
MSDRTRVGMGNGRVTRRALVGGAAAAGMLGLTGGAWAQEERPAEKAGRKGQYKHSICYWCFQPYWNLARACEVAKKLGIKSIELVDPPDYPLLKEHGLVCALSNSHGFEKGFNNLKYHERCIKIIREQVDACAEFGFPNVITFTGFREDIPDDVGLKNCVTGLKKVVGYAEKKKVTLILEMLNSRVDAEMKGHPGYQGDHVDYCIEIIKQVGSPRLKLLFDVYHVQIMDGDVITRIRQYHEYIGHYHVAGNPGRNEPDENQEINYPAVMRAIAETGYTGYVAQEFVPTRDPLKSLTEAVKLCTV